MCARPITNKLHSRGKIVVGGKVLPRIHTWRRLALISASLCAQLFLDWTHPLLPDLVGFNLLPSGINSGLRGELIEKFESTVILFQMTHGCFVKSTTKNTFLN